MAVERALRRMGWSDSASAEGMATAYRVSSTVDSVRVTSAHSLQVFPKGSSPFRAYGVELWNRGGRLPATDPDDGMAVTLKQWAELLDRSGDLVQVFRLGHTFSAPADDLDHAIASLQRGDPLSPSDSTALGRIAHSPAEWEAVRRPVQLERLRP